MDNYTCEYLCIGTTIEWLRHCMYIKVKIILDCRAVVRHKNHVSR